MAKDFDENKYFNRLLAKACKGTSITPRELLRELIGIGYQNVSDIDFSLEDLKEIVADLVDSKDNAAIYNIPSSSRKVTEVNE